MIPIAADPEFAPVTDAATLEKVIRDKASAVELDSAKQQVAAVLDPLVAALKASLGATESAAAMSASAAPVDAAQSREAAAQLAKLLSEFDPAAADFTTSNRAALQPLFADGQWSRFENLVQGYSFSEAQAQLERVIAALPNT